MRRAGSEDGRPTGWTPWRPAYGRRILQSVTFGWAMAGGVAVLVAAGAGWLAMPLLELTATTRQMAQGDLSARASVGRPDELGLLAGSFNQMASRVEETVAALRRFVADAAHELHTPLTAIQTDLELALATAAPPQTARLERAQQQLARLQKLTADLLDLSRLESATAVADHQTLDLEALVRRSCEPFASRAEQAGIDFQLIPAGEPLRVRGDARQLEQALGNLLDNALKFTAAGGQVRVQVGRDGRWAFVAVEDSGIGLLAADLPYRPARFYRGRNAAAYPGSGLGLAIARAILAGHGGQLRFAAGAAGSAVTLQLPIKPE